MTVVLGLSATQYLHRKKGCWGASCGRYLRHSMSDDENLRSVCHIAFFCQYCGTTRSLLFDTSKCRSRIPFLFGNAIPFPPLPTRNCHKGTHSPSCDNSRISYGRSKSWRAVQHAAGHLQPCAPSRCGCIPTIKRVGGDISVLRIWFLQVCSSNTWRQHCQE